MIDVSVLTIAIMDDQLPEDDETVVVRLFNPTGGAAVDGNGTITVIISANDHVGGVLSFQKSTLAASEGDDVILMVNRTLPALGNVSVGWRIDGVGTADPSRGFAQHNGTIYFKQVR